MKFYKKNQVFIFKKDLNAIKDLNEIVNLDIKLMDAEQLKLKVVELASMYRAERIKADEMQK